MLANKKEFTTGLLMMAAFLIVLVVMFMPVFGGHNALNYFDKLYNSISKGSAYYVPDLKKKIEKLPAKSITVTLNLKDDAEAKTVGNLLMKSGAMVNVTGAQLKVSGEMNALMKNALDDADDLFHNRGESVKTRYQMDERLAGYGWWVGIKAIIKDLNRQRLFAEAKQLAEINKKAVECAYNYYGIEPQNIKDQWFIVFFSLAFYVIYTVWYGYSILFMFEGWGLKLEH
ncbi:hypothetical protein [Desulfatirhabdium butyrativorans]|uniref:hypothetical protein n=1 Tax=Desulfatirhabdium butyrativorans TaxID=340467 RepID=UPI0004251952|nr:hypothetical protein [Desulfatirhabdium butyrativorans]